MTRRIWILLAAGGAAALFAWRVWPGSRSSASGPSPSLAGSNAGTAADSAQEDGPRSPAAAGARDGRTPPPPIRMQARSQTPAGPRAGLSVLFDGEERNDEWATKREEEVRVRASRVLAAAAADASLGRVECRSRSCRFPVSAGDPASVARAIEQLGEESGFYRFADQMTVEATEPGEGGPRQVNVYLRFSR